jgi:hypothetical protein
MFKYIAFDLYKTNELGAHQPAAVMAGQKSREVYLAADADARIEKLENALREIHQLPDFSMNIARDLAARALMEK